MKNILALLFLSVLLSTSGLSQGVNPTRWTEVDGSPSVSAPSVVKFPNGTLTCSGKICTLTTGTGGGTVTSVSFTGGLISVANPTTTPAFTVAGTSGGIPYFSAANTWASSGALAANALVRGGGAGAAPATITTGTGVITALGVNTGSAGAFVVLNGAGGTPSSLTLTSATGLPPTTGISGWPANASGCLSNNGAGTLTWAACSGGGSQTPWTANVDADGFSLLFDDSTGIKSSEAGNGPLLTFVSAASAVNGLKLTNTATGGSSATTVTLEFDGSDTNGSIWLKPKGTDVTNGGQIVTSPSPRFDRPAFTVDAARNLGWGFKSGLAWWSVNAPNIMLGAGDTALGTIAMPKLAQLAWNVNATSAEDCPACVAVGFNQAALRVIGVVGADSTPDGDLTHGATFGFIANTPAQITANQNDYDPGDASYFQRWSTDASRNVTGLTFAISTKVSGQIHRIWNVGSFNIVLVNDATSTAANRFLTSTGSDITLATKECADVQYDTTQSRWLTTPCAVAGAGSGTVTSVAQSFTGGLISVGGSPVTTSGTLALTVAGTSGGIPYFSGATTWASSGALTANLPVIGGGAGAAPTVGTRSGNTTAFVTTTGTLTSGRCVEIDASGNFIQSAAACGGGGGSPGGSTGDYQINNGGSFGAGVLVQGSTGRLVATPTLASSGVAPYTRIITPADTAQTADAEFPGIVFGGNSSSATVTRQTADGTTITTQREYLFVNPTYTAAGATTITNAATVAIAAAPVASTNITQTNSYALFVQAGASRFDGQVMTPLGTQAAPGLVIGNAIASTGFHGNGTRIQISIANTVGPVFFGSGIYNKATGIIGWDSSSDPVNSTPDVALTRHAAGVLQINNGTAGTYRDVFVRQYLADQTITTAGTTGNQTINKSAGTVNVASAGSPTSVTVTNSLVTTSSTIYVSTRTNDSTCSFKNAVPAAGSFVINLTAACTAETSFGFLVVN